MRLEHLQDCKQGLENEVSQLQNVVKKFNIEKIDNVFQTTSSVDDGAFVDIVCSIIDNEKDDVNVLTPSLLVVIVEASPKFVKHTIGIGS